MFVRPVVLADVEAIGAVHVRAWQATYRSEMPAEYLDGLDPAERAGYWHAFLSRPQTPDSQLIVVEIDGEVGGFACFGRSADDQGELYAMNIDPDAWRGGLGRALLNAVETNLSVLGCSEGVLWVTARNTQAQNFYVANGWTSGVRTRQEQVFGTEVSEVQFQKRLQPKS